MCDWQWTIKYFKELRHIVKYAFPYADLVNDVEYKFEPLINLQHITYYHTPFFHMSVRRSYISTAFVVLRIVWWDARNKKLKSNLNMVYHSHCKISSLKVVFGENYQHSLTSISYHDGILFLQPNAFFWAKTRHVAKYSKRIRVRKMQQTKQKQCDFYSIFSTKKQTSLSSGFTVAQYIVYTIDTVVQVSNVFLKLPIFLNNKSPNFN